jgi:hypothetical protein
MFDEEPGASLARVVGAVVFGWRADDRPIVWRPRDGSLSELSESLFLLDNDPSAGSPTETLLRLLPGSSHCD